jgi:hypothetical protein
MGAEALREIVKRVDLDRMAKEAVAHLNTAKNLVQ